MIEEFFSFKNNMYDNKRFAIKKIKAIKLVPTLSITNNKTKFYSLLEKYLKGSKALSIVDFFIVSFWIKDTKYITRVRIEYLRLLRTIISYKRLQAIYRLESPGFLHKLFLFIKIVNYD